MYVELHAHSFFSLLDGASSPGGLLDHAAALDMDALALTDHDALYGAVCFYQAARERGIKPILGAELTLEGGYHLDVLAYSTLNAFRTLLGDVEIVDPIGPSISKERPIDSLVDQLCDVHGLTLRTADEA